jgi:hypothetical protein
VGFDWEEAARLDAAKNACAEERNLDRNVLCARCTSGVVMQRGGKLHVVVYCHALTQFVPTDIVKCSSFTDVKAMDFDQMKQIAVIIDPRTGINDGAYR